MSQGVVDFGPFTNDVFNGEMTVNQARDKLNSLEMSEHEEKRYDTILVVGKNQEQARSLWQDMKDKYKKTTWGFVKFAGRKERQLDGHRPFGMLIVLVGEYWLNPITNCETFQMFKRLGADVVEEV
ncbi:hypothetical protein ACM1RC_30325 [Paenibacillus azoreducens]|uniref:hypothetical protein n=1 Tax=Paenibacillus azoreducens TaxID=116718 RepID=UPI0039F4D572